jgi:hypothetical protein
LKYFSILNQSIMIWYIYLIYYYFSNWHNSYYTTMYSNWPTPLSTLLENGIQKTSCGFDANYCKYNVSINHMPKQNYTPQTFFFFFFFFFGVCSPSQKVSDFSTISYEHIRQFSWRGAYNWIVHNVNYKYSNYPLLELFVSSMHH